MEEQHRPSTGVINITRVEVMRKWVDEASVQKEYINGAM